MFPFNGSWITSPFLLVIFISTVCCEVKLNFVIPSSSLKLSFMQLNTLGSLLVNRNRMWSCRAKELVFWHGRKPEWSAYSRDNSVLRCVMANSRFLSRNNASIWAQCFHMMIFRNRLLNFVWKQVGTTLDVYSLGSAENTKFQCRWDCT